MVPINGRVAVSLLFLMNGFLIGNWAPKIPEFASRLSLDESQMGIILVIFGIGAIITMPLTGVAVARLGGAMVSRFMSVICATMLLWITLAPNVWTAAAIAFLLGGFVSGMDVAMNAVAVDVERHRSRAIMSSAHGFWSLGGLIGSIGGGYLLQYSGLMGQAVVATVVSLGLVALAWRHLGPFGEPMSGEVLPIRFPRTLLPYLVGMIALFSAMPEGAILDWSALYLRQELGATVFLSAFAFGAFSAAMALVRFAGDPIRQRYGAVKTLRACAAIAVVGLLLSGLSSEPWLVIAGFAITGLGLSNLVPIAFSAAGNLPGLAPGIGLSVATTIGYSGILVAPALIGFLAEHTGFALIFSSLSILLLVVLMLAPLSRYADFNQS